VRSRARRHPAPAVYNKVDRLNDDERHALDNEPDSVTISALDKSSTKTLLNRVESWLTLIDHQRATRAASDEADVCCTKPEHLLGAVSRRKLALQAASDAVTDPITGGDAFVAERGERAARVATQQARAIAPVTT